MSSSKLRTAHTNLQEIKDTCLDEQGASGWTQMKERGIWRAETRPRWSRRKAETLSEHTAMDLRVAKSTWSCIWKEPEGQQERFQSTWRTRRWIYEWEIMLNQPDSNLQGDDWLGGRGQSSGCCLSPLQSSFWHRLPETNRWSPGWINEQWLDWKLAELPGWRDCDQQQEVQPETNL